MSAIATPCLELFTCTGQRVGFCTNGVAIARHDTAFLGQHAALGRGFRLTVTFQNKPVRPISAAAAAAQSNAETEQVEIISSEQCETVRVRFKLQKECAFGQEYMIVGDDEVLGSWNPSDGVSLTWSEGHMWTTEVDLPVHKVIKYKFILKGVVGAVSWQPGPDRVLKTWKTEKMISVSEDWDNPGLQNIVEDEPAADPIESDPKSSIAADAENSNSANSSIAADAENLSSAKSSIAANVENSNSAKSIKKNPKSNGDAKNQVKHSAPMATKKVTKKAQKENLSSNDKASLRSNDKVSAPVSQANSEKKEMSLGDSGSVVKVENNSISSEDNEEAPVLVPGLVPEEEIGEAELNKAAELNTECASASAPLRSSGSNGEMITDEKQQSNDKQQHGEMINDEKQPPIDKQQHGEMIIDEKRQPNDKQQHDEMISDEKQQPENIVETDVQWGKQTLYKFLSKFLFQ